MKGEEMKMIKLTDYFCGAPVFVRVDSITAVRQMKGFVDIGIFGGPGLGIAESLDHIMTEIEMATSETERKDQK